MKKHLRATALGLALLMMLLTGCQAAPAATTTPPVKDLVIFTWADYLPADILDEFMKESGVNVVYTYFESNEEMLTKLQSSDGAQYDLVLASDYIIDLAREQNLAQKLDKSKIPNFGDIDPVMQGQYYDETNEYTVPFAAGTPLIVYDPARVSIDIKGYNDLWNPALKDSIVIMDDMRNVMGITLKSMGQSFNVTDPAIIKAAGEKLMGLKDNIRVFDYNEPHMKMIAGETTVGYMFTPQVLWALSERPDLKVVYPQEGMGFGIDSFFIPSKAPNPDAAHKFLEFVLRGEISARLSEWTQYINCVSTAKAFMPEEVLSSEVLYIPSEILGDAEFIENIGAEATTLFDAEWIKFKQ